MTADATQDTGRPEAEPVLKAISTEMVRLYKEQFGRGPSRARTYWAGPDMIITVLDETFAQVERNLAGMGEHQRLREARMFWQYAMVAEFCTPIERLTGRTVRSFQSSTDTETDGTSIECFILHPEGSDEPSRATAPSVRRGEPQADL